MSNEPNERATRLLPQIRRVALKYAGLIDADDLAQEGMLAAMTIEAGHEDAYYVQAAKWAILAALKSPRYRDIPSDAEPSGSRHTAVSADSAGSALLLRDLSPQARTVALMRWAGASWNECRAEVGRNPCDRAAHELRTWVARMEVTR